jgi:hypothetical protein
MPTGQGKWKEVQESQVGDPQGVLGTMMSSDHGTFPEGPLPIQHLLTVSAPSHPNIQKSMTGMNY